MSTNFDEIFGRLACVTSDKRLDGFDGDPENGVDTRTFLKGRDFLTLLDVGNCTNYCS